MGIKVHDHDFLYAFNVFEQELCNNIIGSISTQVYCIHVYTAYIIP